MSGFGFSTAAVKQRGEISIASIINPNTSACNSQLEMEILLEIRILQPSCFSNVFKIYCLIEMTQVANAYLQ